MIGGASFHQLSSGIEKNAVPLILSKLRVFVSDETDIKGILIKTEMSLPAI